MEEASQQAREGAVEQERERERVQESAYIGKKEKECKEGGKALFFLVEQQLSAGLWHGAVAAVKNKEKRGGRGDTWRPPGTRHAQEVGASRYSLKFDLSSRSRTL